MLSITLPTITETIALNGVPVDVRPLPLFFIENVQQAYPRPNKDTDPHAHAAWLRCWVAVRAIEAIGLSSEVAGGRPGWDRPDDWPRYAEACVDALGAAGFTTTHINAISDAVSRLDARQLEALKPVGNS